MVHNGSAPGYAIDRRKLWSHSAPLALTFCRRHGGNLSPSNGTRWIGRHWSKSLRDILKRKDDEGQDGPSDYIWRCRKTKELVNGLSTFVPLLTHWNSICPLHLCSKKNVHVQRVSFPKPAAFKFEGSTWRWVDRSAFVVSHCTALRTRRNCALLLKKTTELAICGHRIYLARWIHPFSFLQKSQTLTTVMQILLTFYWWVLLGCHRWCNEQLFVISQLLPFSFRCTSTNLLSALNLLW